MKRKLRPRYAAPKRTPGVWKRVLTLCAAAVLGFYLCVAATFILLRWIDPPTTAVMMERRMSAFIAHQPYQKRYRFVPLESMSAQIVHAVISAEDDRFYRHGGFDWKEVDKAIHDDLEKGKRRGASTIDQQLARNLFLSTSPNLIRKALEYSIVPVEEWTLPKRRILELYLNVAELGKGIYGVEAASQVYFHLPASRVSRKQALELAALLPAPTRRRPNSAEWYVEIIDTRMRENGW